jgi:hypothetical protein
MQMRVLEAAEVLTCAQRMINLCPDVMGLGQCVLMRVVKPALPPSKQRFFRMYNTAQSLVRIIGIIAVFTTQRTQLIAHVLDVGLKTPRLTAQILNLFSVVRRAWR